MQFLKGCSVSKKRENTADLVIDLFNEKANSWSDKYSQVLKNRLNAFETELKTYSKTHKSLLDFGCGTGIMLRMAFKLGYNVKGLDISPKMVAHCKKESENCIPDLEVKCYSFIENYLDFINTDIILCSSVYEYLENPELYLDLFYKILNKDGIILLTVPNIKTVTRLFESILKNLIKTIPFITNVHPRISGIAKYLYSSKNRQSLRKLRQAFGMHKFEIISKKYINSKSSNNFNNYIDSNLILFVLKKIE